MSHYHELPNGQKTSSDFVSRKNSLVHWHAFEGEISSAEEYGPLHKHTLNGVELSGPLSYEQEQRGFNVMKQTKVFGGHIVETKQEERNGVPVGLISGYIATWDVDRGLDRFVKGAFAKSLEEHRQKRRQIRFKDHHGRTVGGFPMENVREDEKGLFGVAEVNLEVEQGRDAFSLAKQNVLTDFSIGYSSLKDYVESGVRVIEEAYIWEGSIVDEPMNPNASIVEVKAAVPFQDLPLASRERSWDSDAALNRVRELTDSTDAPSSDYRRAFLWYDSEDAQNFGAYKLPIADVIDGRLTVVPRGVFAAAAALLGARGGVDIPDSDRQAVINHVERYYAKMDIESPFDDDKSFFTVADAETMTERDLEKALRASGMFSKDFAKLISSRFSSQEKRYTLEEAQVLISLKSLRELV